MVNIQKLKGKIVEKGLTIEKLGKSIGIDKSTLYRKINRLGSDFTIKEVNLLIKELEICNEEAIAIFFCE